MPSWGSGGRTPPNIAAAIAAAMLSWVPGRGGGKGMGGGARGKVEVAGGAVCVKGGEEETGYTFVLTFCGGHLRGSRGPFPIVVVVSLQ